MSNDGKECIRCSNCNDVFLMKCWWDESGYGYSTKLARCPQCGKIIVVKMVEDRWMDVNSDIRYYKY